MSKRASEIYDDENIWDFRSEIKHTGKDIRKKIEGEGDSDNAIVEARLGICYRCDNCSWCITEFDNISAVCNYLEMRLSGRDKMKKCTDFKRKGEMSLQTMAGMAWLIDIPKDGAGFIKK